MVQNIDFAPTLLDFAGARIPEDMQGCSIRPLLEGRTPPGWRDKIYYHYYEGYDIPEQYGVRTKNYKLICYPEFENRPCWELFDLKSDPVEMNNVHADPAYSGILKKLEADLAELRARYGDTEERPISSRYGSFKSWTAGSSRPSMFGSGYRLTASPSPTSM